MYRRNEKRERAGKGRNQPLRFLKVGFAYDAQAAPLFEGLTLHCGRGWTGVIGANGVGKSTLLKLATGRLEPVKGVVEAPADSLYCPQRTDDPPEGLAALLESFDGPACSWKGRLGVQEDWLVRWHSLSHGERKRAQMAVALWGMPAVLAVDEPTNHIDARGRALIGAALSAYEGVGLLVSHDRVLLDRLCHQCLFMDPPRVALYPGGYTEALVQEEAERGRLRRELDEASRAVRRLETEAVRWREDASRSHKRRSKRGLAIKDHDARAKINKARVSGKDGAGGRRLNQLQGRLEQAKGRKDGIAVRKGYAMGIRMGGASCGRDLLVRLPAGTLAMGTRVLRHPDLTLAPGERVACVGPNGCGKSTLVRHVQKTLSLPEDRVVYLPQEIDRKEGEKILAQVRSLPKTALGEVMTLVSRLGSRPGRLLETETPSPGEVRKLLLAIGLARNPYLVVMDEPTNHLDLPSIRCLEEALRDCSSGLLLVSHDERFVGCLAERSWRFVAADDGARVEVTW